MCIIIEVLNCKPNIKMSSGSNLRRICSRMVMAKLVFYVRLELGGARPLTLLVTTVALAFVDPKLRCQCQTHEFGKSLSRTVKQQLDMVSILSCNVCLVSREKEFLHV